MSYWHLVGMGRSADPAEAQREQESNRLLREAGAFRRGSGVRHARSEGEARRGSVRWEEWAEARVREFRPGGVFETLADLCEALGLSARQRDTLYLHRLEELTYREVARALGVTVWRVRVLLRRADERWRLTRHEPPVSARQLFYEEIRQKRASIYSAPKRWRQAGRRSRARSWEERKRGTTGRRAG